jgi:MSHA biogenesis protein MshO
MIKAARGVTLIEMIVVMAITGIVAAAVATFIRTPVQSYIDAAHRAELTDIADTALRRITRDLRMALPNSVRVDGTQRFIEYLQTSGGGRYRAEQTGGVPTGDILDFTAPDDRFDVIGPMPAFAGGESIVIYNLSSVGGTANAYIGDNREAVDVPASGAMVVLLAARQFPFASPGKRFQVVQHAVTYGCNLATGELRRYWNYGIGNPQPTPPVTPNNALLATNVTDCSFTYTEVTQRDGLVALFLQVGTGETVRLFQQAHINNVP